MRLLAFICCTWLPEATGSPWIEALKAKKYVVQEGSYDFFDIKTCASADTCYAMNPLTPYGLIYLPPHANESSSGNYSNTCHQHGLCKKINGMIYSPAWRIAPGEVIVLLGRTPPESTYWSFASSLYTRFNGPGFKPSPRSLQDFPGACPKVPLEGSAGDRCEVFSAVNDPVNFQTVNLSSQSPFNTSFALMLSWDSETEKEVATHMEATGIGPLNFLRHPGAISRLGVTGGKEDEFINVLRVENIKDADASKKFYTGTPFQVLRISRSLENSPATDSFYPSFDGKMRTRVTGKSESGENVTNQQLRHGLKLLKQRVIQGNSGFSFTSLDFDSFVNDSGYECLQRGLKCQGDCRDTIYARATLLIQEGLCNKSHLACKPSRHAELTSEPSDSFLVMGVNHKMTNQSLYSSITVYNYPKLAAGILKRSSGHMQYTMLDRDFQGSALQFLPDHPAAPYLYIVKFARRCLPGDRYICLEVASWPDSSNVTAIAEYEPLVFIERMYIRPGTKTAPAVAETIMPILVHFKASHAHQDEHALKAVFV
eukprot:CAMPEP_0197653222 /NCGR_PEP_ID=MMETSP1338-20131121/34926_1 /TAXON_ID=43686 ORGANISM="Pelagodinium beii, Strain RCC1491" /NCGR_SAMPLE_ID=MMETSP1338 /ASSEMBLY_ACC=CAM_ASM_000754 /LENGTH=540 /DNA_ID=CAMNT_0043228259 /DNA_START=96 /DNA_END=1718 /DNA_ORIENTATION=-